MAGFCMRGLCLTKPDFLISMCSVYRRRKNWIPDQVGNDVGTWGVVCYYPLKESSRLKTPASKNLPR